MKTYIVLVMHGAPPLDFPREDIMELFSLGARLEQLPPDACGPAGERLAALEARVRLWPRTVENDPFYAGSVELADALQKLVSDPVLLSFNEFCAPTMEDAFAEAVTQGAGQVLVVTPMMTRGGEHSEIDIPRAVAAAGRQYPHVSFRYVWPLDTAGIARFLASEIDKYREKI